MQQHAQSSQHLEDTQTYIHPYAQKEKYLINKQTSILKENKIVFLVIPVPKRCDGLAISFIK